MRIALLVGCLSILGAGGTAVAQPSDGSGMAIVGRGFDAADMPRGASSVLNDATSGDQRRPSVAAFSDGDYVVVWDGPEPGDAALGIFARTFASDGTPLGAELQINTYTTGTQRRPHVGVMNDAAFIVVWDSSGARDGSGSAVFAQRLSRAGERIGTEFQVNRSTAGAQEAANVTATTDGFVVVWEGDRPGSNVPAIYGQRFDGDAQAVGTELQVSSYSDAGQRRPAVGGTPNGGFIVVWDSGGQDGGGRGIFARRHADTGAPIGGELQINSYTAGAQRSPALAVDGLGGFLVVWQSAGQDGSGSGIFAQRYDGDGVRIGTELQINTATTGDQANPDVAVDGDAFVIVWQSFGDDGESYGIVARRYDVNGVGAAVFPINEDGAGEQTVPALSSAGDGVVVVWQSRPHCAGDCDDNGAVTVDELVRGVNLALARPVQFCPAIDPDGDLSVTVDELVRAVNATLAGCPP